VASYTETEPAQHKRSLELRFTVDGRCCIMFKQNRMSLLVQRIEEKMIFGCMLFMREIPIDFNRILAIKPNYISKRALMLQGSNYIIFNL